MASCGLLRALGLDRPPCACIPEQSESACHTVTALFVVLLCASLDWTTDAAAYQGSRDEGSRDVPHEPVLEGPASFSFFLLRVRLSFTPNTKYPIARPVQPLYVTRGDPPQH